jgi:phosphatidylglycerol:prolipoprotein diacylglycerol transferase
MKNELLTIGPVTIYGYGLMIAIGIIAAYTVAEFRAKRKGLNHELIFDLTIWCLIGGIVGAKLLFLITELKDIIADPSLLLDVSRGFVVYGGIIGGIFSGYLYTRIKKLNFLQYFDLVMPSIALAQGFGRVGCLLAGCCYGEETTSAFHLIFHTSEFAPNGVALIPTQPISSFLDFLNFFALITISKRTKSDGQVAGFYLVFYSAGRFILEFFRGDLDRGQVGPLSTSQFISIFSFLIGLAIVIFFGLHPRRTVVMEDTEAEPSKELLSEESPREATTKKVVTEIAEDGHEVIIEEYDPQDKNY